MNKERSIRNLINYKFQLKSKRRMYVKLKTILAIRAGKTEMFIRVLLKCIQLQKELFVLELEQGQQVFIPNELNQKGLPYSFRYYDPILSYVYDYCTDEKRQVFATQHKMNMERIKHDDVQQKIL